MEGPAENSTIDQVFAQSLEEWWKREGKGRYGSKLALAPKVGVSLQMVKQYFRGRNFPSEVPAAKFYELTAIPCLLPDPAANIRNEIERERRNKIGLSLTPEQLKERKKAQHQAWRGRNKQKLGNYQREYRRDNREKVRAAGRKQAKAYRKKNPDYFRAVNKRRRPQQREWQRLRYRILHPDWGAQRRRHKTICEALKLVRRHFRGEKVRQTADQIIGFCGYMLRTGDIAQEFKPFFRALKLELNADAIRCLIEKPARDMDLFALATRIDREHEKLASKPKHVRANAQPLQDSQQAAAAVPSSRQISAVFMDRGIRMAEPK